MECAERKRFTKKRSIVKSQLTRLQTFIDNYTDSNDIHEVKVRKKHLSELWDKFQDIQGELEVGDDEQQDESYRTQFESMYFEVASKFELILDKREQSVGASIGTVNTQVNLPKITLPNFDGSYRQWPAFCDSFKCMVHENNSLSAIQKLHYLRSSLKGEAFQLISTLPTTDSNYSVAWNLLSERYENKKLIASTYVSELLNVNCVNKENAGELRQFVNVATSNLNALKALELDVPLEEIILLCHFVSKLDVNTRKEWELRNTNNSFPQITDLFSFLEHRCQVLESLGKNQMRTK